MGDGFVKLLADAQREDKYDLVIINPLQGVCAGMKNASWSEERSYREKPLPSP